MPTSSRVRRRRASRFLLAGLLALLVAPAAGAQPEAGSVVDVVEVDGLLSGTVADFVVGTIAKAESEGSALVAIELDTPGGLGDAGERVAAAIVDSEVPVLVYVGDAGARAVGAGAVIAQAAHILALSPVTQLGAAVPADLGADDPEVDRASTADRVAELASLRGRSPAIARETASADRVVVVLPPEGALRTELDPADVVAGAQPLPLTPDEVVESGVADLVEPSLSAVLDRLEGYEVDVPGSSGDGGTRVLAVDSEVSEVRFANLGLLAQLLVTVTSPTLAYLLLIAGALCLAFEVFQPGFGVAGVTGIAMLVLGAYGLAVLPVGGLALAAVVLGLVLLAIDLAVGGFGWVTAAGSLLLLGGSLWLFDGPPLLRPSPWMVVGVVAFTIVFFVVIMTTVLRAQGSQAMAGAETVVGKRAVVRSMLNPEGHVFVEGSLWRARAPEAAGKVKTGTVVRVVGLDDRLTLEVALDGGGGELLDAPDGAAPAGVG